MSRSRFPSRMGLSSGFLVHAGLPRLLFLWFSGPVGVALARTVLFHPTRCGVMLDRSRTVHSHVHSHVLLACSFFFLSLLFSCFFFFFVFFVRGKDDRGALDDQPWRQPIHLRMRSVRTRLERRASTASDPRGTRRRCRAGTLDWRHSTPLSSFVSRGAVPTTTQRTLVAVKIGSEWTVAKGISNVSTIDSES